MKCRNVASIIIYSQLIKSTYEIVITFALALITFKTYQLIYIHMNSLYLHIYTSSSYFLNREEMFTKSLKN